MAQQVTTSDRECHRMRASKKIAKISDSEWQRVVSVVVKSRRISSQQNLWSKFSTICVLLTEHFFVVFGNVFIAMVHTEATLKGLDKPVLIKLVLQVESEFRN